MLLLNVAHLTLMGRIEDLTGPRPMQPIPHRKVDNGKGINMPSMVGGWVGCGGSRLPIYSRFTSLSDNGDPIACISIKLIPSFLLLHKVTDICWDTCGYQAAPSPFSFMIDITRWI